MRIGIISDIHCNIAALDIALEKMGNDVDEVLVAGDAIFQFRFSNEVIGRLREVGARIVLGNHEEVVLSAAGIRVREHERTDQELLKWLSEQPYRIDTEIGGKKFTMFHASPWEPMEYVYGDSKRIKEFADLRSDYVVYGHTHYALDLQLNGTRVINPGSTGQPRDPSNGFRASYAILDTQSDEVTFEVFDDPMRPQVG